MRPVKKGRDGEDLDIIKAVEQFWLENGYPPTRRDLLERTKASSTSMISRALLRLAKKGLVKITRGRPIPQKLHQKVQRMFKEKINNEPTG